MYLHAPAAWIERCLSVPVSPRWRSTRRLAATLPGVTVSGKSANLTWLISFYGNIYGNAPPGLAAGSAVMRTSGARNIGLLERDVCDVFGRKIWLEMISCLAYRMGRVVKDVNQTVRR